MSSQRYIEHPILGFLVFQGSSQEGLRSLRFADTPPEGPQSEDPLLLDVEEQLQRYLLGDMVSFDTIPLAPQGTAFQKRVWQALTTIGWGEKRSYKWVADQIGRPNGYRAVGNANGKNPIPIIIPCHRVIAHDGSLGGYTGGLHIKNFLLSLEQHLPLQPSLGVDDYLRPARSRAITLL